MGWRAYGEPEPKPSLLAECMIGALWGAMCVFVYGSVFIWLEWITKTHLLIAILVASPATGAYCGWSFLQCSKKKTEHTIETEEELYDIRR